MKQIIINYIRAGYPRLYLVSPEEQRGEAEIKAIATEIKYNLFFRSVVNGLVDVEKGTNNSANDPLEALIAIRDLKEQTIIFLRDFHLFLQDPNPILLRQLKDVLQMAKTKSKALIILGCRMVLLPELEPELTVKEWLLKRLHAFSQRAIEYGLPTPKGLLILKIAGTGKGLTAKAKQKCSESPC
jgi:hypothetical protein